jgi:filamentous hemagglutinin family protein
MKGIDSRRLGSTRSRSIAAKLHVKPLALLVSLLATGQALAVQNGTVTGGAATITPNGATTTIQQNSDRAIVAWNNFDIGQGERVTIKQPNANAAILNRVTGATSATQIQGALDANGRVFIINPKGIVVGQQGSINANSVVLSTFNVSDSAFMTGDSLMMAVSDGSGADLRNDGTITATRGAVLLGNQVVNGATGQITAPQGNVSLVADRSATINLMPDGSLTATSGGNGPQTTLVANDGRITVGGSVLMQTSPGAIVRNTGTIEATGLADLTNAGTVTLKVENGTVNASGTVTAQQVRLSATNVTQAADASLRADGNLSINAAGQVVLNGSTSVGNTLTLDRAGSTYADLTLNGAVAAQNIDLHADRLNVAQNASIDATNLSARSDRDMKVEGRLSADSIALASSSGNLNIDGDKLSGNRINLSSGGGQVSIAGDITTSNLSISTKDFTQAADTSLHADDNLSITAWGQVELNGNLSAGGTFALLNPNYNSYANVTLNGAVTAQNISLSTNQLGVSQNAKVNANSVSLSSLGQTNIAGSVVATSSLSIRGGDVTQTADGLLRFGDMMTVSSPNSVLLNGTIDAGSLYRVTAQGQEFRFGTGLYQPGQGFGGANALPTAARGGMVTSGTGSITQDGSTTNVVQTSDKLIIDWQDFNIAAGESINFLQPNANAAVLNMVSTRNATTIDGALNANGRVYILNPYGIVVGNTGTINANSVTLAAGVLLFERDEDVLSADTWNVYPDSFIVGRSAGYVRNWGTIATKTGVTLIGSEVMNLTAGRITTGKGNLAMVAGGNVQVSQNADGSMSRVDALDSIANAHVVNDGRITVDNGYAKLDAYTSTPGQAEVARSLGQIDALNRSGNVSAPGELAAGNILISGRNSSDTSGTVNIRGRLNGQNVTVHSDGDLYLYGGGTLSTWQRGADSSAQKVTLEGNRIIVGPEGFNIDGSAVLRGVGYRPVFEQRGSFNVIGNDLSLIDFDTLQ